MKIERIRKVEPVEKVKLERPVTDMPFYRGVYGCISAGGKYFLQDITIYEASCILCHLAVCQLLIMNANLADSAVNPC